MTTTEAAAATAATPELGGSGDASTAYTGSEIHIADSPDGPFLPLKTSYSGCNNPSPWVMKNGTILVRALPALLTPLPHMVWSLCRSLSVDHDRKSLT